MKPVLLVDIDGVLSPLGRVADDYVAVEVTGVEVLVSPTTAGWLRELGEVFELHWASMWTDQADLYGALVGLPPLPYIDLFGCYWTKPDHVLTAKLPLVEQYVAEELAARPVAWVDDHVWEDADRWAFRRTAFEAPTLVVHVNGMEGLRRHQVARLLAWAVQVQDNVV